MIGKTISHYKILEKLGEGGMGVVYKAEDTKLKRTVALKFLPHHLLTNEEDKTRFLHEAQAASALNHPNIMTIHEIDEVDEKSFIVMEYVEGENLKDKVEKGPLRTKELLNIAIAVADGLNAAHEQEIVHRDIKSENIMISKTGIVKIMDFGLAKRKGMSRITKAGSTLGTLAYMSPEQAEGLEVDRRSDLFSFGVVLYEMATGKLPFRGEHDAAILYSIVNEVPLPVNTLNPNIPPELERFIHKALEKEPEDRYQHADDLAADLRKLKKDLETGKTKAEVTKPKLAVRKRSYLYSVIAGIVILALIAVYFSLSSKPTSGDRKSIAVLPFKNMVSDPANEWFSDGITVDIITQLSKISDLKVISRTSVMLYKDSKKTLREIGKELSVATILEGSVRRADNRVRIVSQLVDARTDKHIWAETYDRDLKDIFAIQSDVAHKIAAALKATLTPEEKSSFERRPTQNLEVYDFYLKGNYYWENYTDLEGNKKAARMYEKAVELDPEFALAYAKLAIVHFALYANITWDHSPERLQKGKTALEKAGELSPDLPEVHRARGGYYDSVLGDYDRALEQYEIALQKQPNSSEILYEMGWIFRDRGEWNQAEKYWLKAYDLDPQNGLSCFYMSVLYKRLRNWTEVVRWANLAISIDPVNGSYYSWKSSAYIDGYGNLAQAREVLEEAEKNTNERYTDLQWRIAFYSRNYQEALQVLASDTTAPYYWEKGVTFSLMEKEAEAAADFDALRAQYEELVKGEPDYAPYHSILGRAYAGLGRKATAIREGERAVELLPVSKSATGGTYRLQALAHIYILVGEYDQAIDQLEYLLSIPSYVSIWRLKLDPLYDPLREHPRFQRLLEGEK